MRGGRVFVLLGHDPDTGAATAATGVLGVGADGTRVVSWIPYHELDGGWRARVATATADDAVARWIELADGVGWDIIELVDASIDLRGDASIDLRGDVEAVVDELLAAAGA